MCVFILIKRVRDNQYFVVITATDQGQIIVYISIFISRYLIKCVYTYIIQLVCAL